MNKLEVNKAAKENGFKSKLTNKEGE